MKICSEAMSWCWRIRVDVFSRYFLGDLPYKWHWGYNPTYRDYFTPFIIGRGSTLQQFHPYKWSYRFLLITGVWAHFVGGGFNHFGNVQPYLGIPILTNMFERGWNHHQGFFFVKKWIFEDNPLGLKGSRREAFLLATCFLHQRISGCWHQRSWPEFMYDLDLPRRMPVANLGLGRDSRA